MDRQGTVIAVTPSGNHGIGLRENGETDPSRRSTRNEALSKSFPADDSPDAPVYPPRPFRRSLGVGGPRAILPVPPVRHPDRPPQRDDAGQQLPEHVELRLRRRSQQLRDIRVDRAEASTRRRSITVSSTPATGTPHRRNGGNVHEGEPGVRQREGPTTGTGTSSTG